MQDEVRWRKPAWSETTCRRTADAVLAAGRKYDLSPALIVAVMLNESDLNEKATIPYYRDGELYAKDGGLMGVRCVFGDPGRCDNGHVQGMSFRAIMDPVKNVELGAKALAYFRDKGGVEKKVVRERNAAGKLVKRTKYVRCKHRNHAWWAHYNHGSFYIAQGLRPALPPPGGRALQPPVQGAGRARARADVHIDIGTDHHARSRPSPAHHRSARGTPLSGAVRQDRPRRRRLRASGHRRPLAPVEHRSRAAPRRGPRAMTHFE